ncbi:hypothetical protein ACLB6G_15335 [Zhengella sp. ZM62]|uniref:pyroglutamyl-peptidase I family protein n=1 Tax=Zhengella sedimenti TaxID=3390035 RepID=UPI0039762A8E
MNARPRILVTGFGPFPGAPENPTEWLVGELAGAAGSRREIATAVLPVDYALAGPALEVAAIAAAPDIAIHFGLAASANGFRLERVASHVQDRSKADNSGRGAPEWLDADMPSASQLPLASMHAALTAAGLPVEWSQDAGGYLCNHVFHLSCSGRCLPLAQATSGFVHIPHVGDGQRLTREAALRGTLIILETCIREWCAARP